MSGYNNACWIFIGHFLFYSFNVSSFMPRLYALFHMLNIHSYFSLSPSLCVSFVDYIINFGSFSFHISWFLSLILFVI